MKVLRFLLSLILGIGLVGTGILGQIAIGTESTVLSADFYQHQFETHNIYDLSQRYVVLRIKEGLNTQLSEPVSKAILAASEEAFSKDWSREQSNRLIQGLLGYATGSSNQLSLSIDLKTRKDMLEQAFISAFAKAGGVNGTHDLTGLPSGLEGGNISRLLPLPDSLDLAQSSFFRQPMVQSSLQILRNYYPVIRYLPMLLMLFLAGWMLVWGWGSGLKWSGICLALSAAIFMVLVSACTGFADRYVVTMASGQDHLVVALGTDPLILARMFRDAVVCVYFRTGIVTGIIGASLALLGFRIEKQAAKSASKPLSAQ